MPPDATSSNPDASVGLAPGRPPRFRRTRQNFLTLLVPIVGSVEELRGLLEQIGGDITQSKKINTWIPFAKLLTTHFCRWVILEGDGRKRPPLLAFESNHDGAVADYLHQLVSDAGPGLHAIYRHCAGYAQRVTLTDAASLARYLGSWQVATTAGHMAYRGNSVASVRNDLAVRDVIQRFLDAHGGELRKLADGQIRDAVKRHLRTEHPELSIHPFQGVLWPNRLPLLKAAAVVLGIGGVAGLVALWGTHRSVFWGVVLGLVALGGVVLFLVRLLHEREGRENADPLDRPVHAGAELKAREDHQVQNQLTHIVDIEDDWFRRLVLRLVLTFIALAARHVYNQGKLGSISSIHFARWVILPDRRLLFFSNYDGSWESYLGDFIDKAAEGLTGIWSNTRGFPRTRNLISEGARDEEAFKAWTRRHQVRTQVWYSAYPTDSVFDIRRAIDIRNGVGAEDLDHEKVKTWLSKL